MISKISCCRVCNNSELNIVVRLGNQTLTGRFPSAKEEAITTGPLELVQCNPATGCGLIQLHHSYDLDEMYGENYGYRSGLNQSMVEHLQSKVNDILDLGILKKGDLVLDIGSNDGTTLNMYPHNLYKLVGIDPSCTKFAKYYHKSIIKIPKFFSSAAYLEHFGDAHAKVVTSFSMFYDLESPVDFAKNVAEILDMNGVWIFEQSYLPTMLKTNSFDTICHEHLEFYTLTQIVDILSRVGLEVLDVDFNHINGGSFSVISTNKNSKYSRNSKKIQNILNDEKKIGLQTGQAFKDFNSRIKKEKDKLISFLREKKTQGKRVCGLGASTKGNVLLQYYEITPDLIESIAEVNSDKFGCYTPNTLIPIKSQKEILESKPDFLVVLPWHFREFFNSRNELKGMKLVYPLPKFEIVEI